jgi:uracil-DNA glycosylase family 4
MPSLLEAREAIIRCERCLRLRQYCQRIAREKRAAFRDDTYWGKPVPGFGDPNAGIAIVGLAPAAHGANRTGRNFTGDGPGGSGDFLMAAMHANGLASQPTSRHKDDGLRLTGAWIAAAVRCAPPDNKPTPREIAACHPHLRAELSALPNVRVIVALGRIAYDSCWRLIAEDHAERLRTEGRWPKKRPRFEHGGVSRLPGAPSIVAAYHPSRQNTNTGRLTPAMLRRAFALAVRELRASGRQWPNDS